MFKPTAALMLMLAGWLLVQLFAHDYVVKQHQHQQQKRSQLINQLQWHQAWQLDALDAVVSSFQAGWQTTPTGLQSQSLQPAISLVFEQQQIDPKIHQQLVVDWSVVGQIDPKDVVKIEFSNQQQQWFFESPEIPLSALSKTLDLSQMTWFFKRPLDQQHSPSKQPVIQMDWGAIGVLDGLVLRFYLSQPRQLTLSAVVIEQSNDKAWGTPPELDCTAVFEQPWLCLVTNQIRYKTQQWAQSQPQQALMFTPLFSWSAWWVLGTAMLLMLLAMRLLIGHSNLSVVGFVVTLFVVTAWLHMGWLVHWTAGLLWLVMLLAMGLFWHHRQWFLRPTGVAWPVWIGTAVVFAAMWFNAVPEPKWWLAFPQYLLWACWQQMILGPVASDFLRKRMAAPMGVIAVLVGALFSLIHAPNHSLMWATLLAGVCWSYSWMRYQNIYANATSHALLALMFYEYMPADWLGSARIGVFF